MYPGAKICPERERLVREADLAINARQMRLARLIEMSDTLKAEESARVRAEVLELSIVALAAWDEYRNHLKEHGC